MKGRKVITGLSFINPRYIYEAEIEAVTDDKHKTRTPYIKRPKAWLIAAVIATMLLLMGAAVYTRWSTTVQFRYNPSEVVKKQAEQSGLSVMLEGTKEADNPDETLSVTDHGITISVLQTIVDEYHAELTFRIEGFELPDGRNPDVWPIVTIDGKEDFYVSQTGNFFDGTTKNETGQWVYASNGQPVELDQDGSVILDYVADDGSLEYTHHIGFQETDGRYLGKEIQVQFKHVGVQSSGKAEPAEHIVNGDWKLKWTLTGTEKSVSVAPNAEIGDSGVILLDAQLGQRTIRTRYRVNDFWEGWDQLVELPQAIWGVRMKDGRELMCIPSTSGFEDQGNMTYFVESTVVNAILDVDQVESLIFHRDWETDANRQPENQTYYYIPISAN